MRNYYRSHPIRRYRMTNLGDFPLWESNGRNDPKADSPVMMPTDQMAVDPAKLPVNQPDTRPVPLAGPVDDPQANSPGQVEAISCQGDAMRPPGAGCVDTAAAMENTGKDLAAAGNAMSATPDNENQTIPASRSAGASFGHGDTAMAADPSAAPITSESTGDKVSKIPFRRQVEDWLKQEKLPYIRVDEAKRALFAGARLRSFHFVVYMAKTGPNWLVWAGPLNRECRLDMQQWESIFGDGFVAVIARPSRSNARGFSLQTLAGQSVLYPI
jgi:hypothetical protein